MSNKSWKEAVSAMSLSTSPCDAEQRAVANRLGVAIPKDLPRVVTVARTQSALAETLGLPSSNSTELQLALLEELAVQVSEPVPSPETSAEAQAWVQYFYLRRREQALCALQLNRGDVVQRPGSSREVDEVSSIGSDGSVYFTGGRARAWPDELTVVTRSGDTSPVGEKARRSAANRASERSLRLAWSTAKAETLKEYAVPEPMEASDIDDLRETIERARDERPLQRLLQARPRILASLLRGPYRYCLPKESFGGKYESDFLLADVDSTGIRWILVELETPDSPVTLASRNDFDDHARQGVSQIQEWRRWLENNLDMARKEKSKDGLGLVDITPRAEGWVIVGRGDRLRQNSADLRDRLFTDRRIRITTYDGLLRQVEGAFQFHGVWAANPHPLHREPVSDRYTLPF